MSLGYLNWLDEIFEEAQVPHNDETAEAIDRALHRIAKVAQGEGSDSEVLAYLKTNFLRQGHSGRGLLAAHLRDELFSKRDGELRPSQGVGYYTNAEYFAD